MITFTPPPGRTIEDSAVDVTAFASQASESLNFHFNSFQMVINHRTTTDEIVRNYYKSMEPKSAYELCRAWNSKHPIGTPVVRYALINPLEEPTITKTRSAAWITRTGRAVIEVENCNGYVALESVMPHVTEAEPVGNPMEADMR